jgi:hypothetical protein
MPPRIAPEQLPEQLPLVDAVGLAYPTQLADLTLGVPRVLEYLVVHRTHLLGVDRSRLDSLIVRSEARKFGQEVDLGALYRQVSGVNAVRLRRLLAALDRETAAASPDDVSPALYAL